MPVMEDAEDEVWLFICMLLSCALVTACGTPCESKASEREEDMVEYVP
jgi:hypothetical protein